MGVFYYDYEQKKHGVLRIVDNSQPLQSEVCNLKGWKTTAMAKFAS